MAPLEVPHFIAHPSGSWSQDVLPLVTLVAGLPTLHIYWRTKRVIDFGIFCTGFVVAALYHYLYMHRDGLEAAKFWGLSGPDWRTLDIIVACLCLTRTAAHALGAYHPVTLAFPNVIFPSLVLIRSCTSPRLELMSLALATCIALLMMKVLVEGLKTFPTYTKWRGYRVLGWAFLGFTCFILPNKLSMYWFWHSMWHIFLGLCYYELYSDLEKEKLMNSSQAKKLK